MTVSLRGGFTGGWSVLGVVSLESGLSWGWFHRMAACFRGDFPGRQSLLGVVSQESALS